MACGLQQVPSDTLRLISKPACSARRRAADARSESRTRAKRRENARGASPSTSKEPPSVLPCPSRTSFSAKSLLARLQASPSRFTAPRTPSRVVSRSSYLTRFRSVSRVTGAQHPLGQRLVARQHRRARIVIYDRYGGSREPGSGRTALEIWHGQHVFTTRFPLL